MASTKDANDKLVPAPIVSLRSSLENKTGTWKNASPVWQEMVAPCRQACPVGNDIPRFIKAIAEDDFTKALAILREESPFPGVTARACSRFCMVPCLKKEVDGKRLAIADLEMAAADYGEPQTPKPLVDKKKSIAIVGAGPTGLTAAYFLVWLGYEVVLFDADDKPGGQLRTDPRYRRVPAEVLDREIELIIEKVDFIPGKRLGENLPWSDLEAYHAVLLAVDEDQLPHEEEFELNKELNVALSRTFKPKVLVGYSALELDIKRWMITYALRAGKRAAIALDLALNDKELSTNGIAIGADGGVSFLHYIEGRPTSFVDDVAAIDDLNLDTMGSRFDNKYPSLPAEAPPIADGSISRHDAVEEAQLCMSCGVCNLCGICVVSCPDFAVLEVDGEIVFDYDYCKGCAICVEECPRGALRLDID